MLPPVFFRPAFSLPSQVWRGVAVFEAIGAEAEASESVGLGEERKRLNIKEHVMRTHSMKNWLENGGISLDMVQKSRDMSHVQ